MIAVKPHVDGAVLPVRARPGARANALIDERDGALLLSVTAPPEDGRANAAIIKLLADDLGLRRSQIELISGTTSKLKAFLVRDICPEDLLARVEAALTPTLFEPPDPDV